MKEVVIAVIGYGRMSGEETTPDAQISELEAVGVDQMFVDLGRLGHSRHRPELDACLAALKPGDTLIVTGFVRLSRSIEHVISLISELYEHGIRLRSLAEDFDSEETPELARFAVMLNNVSGQVIRANTLAGMARAERSGSKPGRPQVMSAEQIKEAQTRRDSGQSWREIGAALGIAHATVRRTVQKNTDSEAGNKA